MVTATRTEKILTSVDGGQTWSSGPLCSEINQVKALAKGYREYASHRSRKREYSQGILVKWCGEIVLP